RFSRLPCGDTDVAASYPWVCDWRHHRKVLLANRNNSRIRCIAPGSHTAERADSRRAEHPAPCVPVRRHICLAEKDQPEGLPGAYGVRARPLYLQSTQAGVSRLLGSTRQDYDAYLTFASKCAGSHSSDAFVRDNPGGGTGSTRTPDQL